MEFLKAAEHSINLAVSELQQHAIPLRDLCALIISYCTNLHLEFEKQLLIAAWLPDNKFGSALWEELKASNHFVLLQYTRKLNEYITRASCEAGAIFSSILTRSSLRICNRFHCYYLNPYPQCVCNSPVY